MCPLVSVIIPVFNGERFLANTLSSVQNQTYNNIQIIIVNDGSSDATVEIAAQYALSDPRFQVVSQLNEGVASARNFGLRHSSGEYVAFLDADDLWNPTKIERQMERLLEMSNTIGVGAVYTLYRTIDANDLVAGSSELWSKAGAVSTHLVTAPVGNGSSILTRRDVALAVGGYDTSYRELDAGGCEDFDFELKLAARFPIGVVSEYLVGYRRYEGTMSADRVRMTRAITAVVERHIQLNPRLSKQCVNWAYGRMYYNCFSYQLGRNHLSALNMMRRLIMCDPAIATRLLAHTLPKIIATRAYDKFCGVVGYHPKSPAASSFFEVSPLAPGPLPVIGIRQLADLAREDKALLSPAIPLR
jgi:glycosyltransferase involved in cell wall biosynthesis